MSEFSLKDIFERLKGSESYNKPCKQAFYNVAAISIAVICLVAAIGVFIILNPFLKPLFWALLCGSALHPFKWKMRNILINLIEDINEMSTLSLAVNVLCSPITVCSRLSEFLGGKLTEYIYHLMSLLFVICMIIFLPEICGSFFVNLYGVVSACTIFVLDVFSKTYVVIPVIIGFVTLLIMYRKNEEKVTSLVFASTITWLAVASYMSSFCGIFHVPLFLLIISLFISGNIYATLRRKDTRESNTSDPKPNNHSFEKSPSEPALPKRSDSEKRTPLRRRLTAQMSFLGLPFSDAPITEHASDKYIYWLSCACVCTFLVKFWWMPHIVSVLLVIYATKSIVVFFGLNEIVKSWMRNLYDALEQDFEKPVMLFIFPDPIIGVYRVLEVCKSKVVSLLRTSIDSISTLIVILSVLVFILVSTIFMITQVYTEGMYLVTASARIINETTLFNEKFNNLIPGNWDDHLDSALNNAYLYGRDAISNMLKNLLKDVKEEKAVEFERMVLELWDRVYQAWMVNAVTNNNHVGPKVTPDAVHQLWNRFFTNIRNTPELINANAIMAFVNNNMETLTSGLLSIWEFTKDNLGLLFYILESLVTTLFSSGFTVLGFFISVVIFITALFYLLSSSMNAYAPVEFMTKFSPNYGNKLAVAIETSVSEVFTVSLKLSVFYGLYTWLLHTLFEMHIIYIPTVVASVFAAVPILPTYCVCLPGVLDLWFMQKNPFLAALLFTLQFLPTNMVDTTIYEDIHGGHPYLTGLAMAGGVFYFGIEGAITGPLILCFLYVIINFSTSILRETQREEKLLQQLAS